ncbi:MAG: hypothetical protein K2X66_08275 [Cyanobacteria bacterium]|nr:hypothetical protein [Cyanobacteriota bacterium]
MAQNSSKHLETLRTIQGESLFLEFVKILPRATTLEEMFMSIDINNCKRCNKVFRKAIREICANCIDEEQVHFKKVYKLLNESGKDNGISMKEIADQVGISSEAVDEIFRHYGFGTATDYLKVPCPTCGTLIMGSHRRGKYCMHCSNEVAKEAGVEIKSRDDLEDAKVAENRLKENLAKQFKESALPGRDDKVQYGLKRFS